MVVWLQLAACAAVIALSGPVLIRNGEIIAARTGLSLSWVGLVLLATVTSLPELFTGLSAVTLANAPNLALGDALGSCVFNLAILVVVDALDRGGPVYGRIDQGHILSAGFGVILIGSVGAAILAGSPFPALAHIGAYSPLILLLYLVTIRIVFDHEQRSVRSGAIADDVKDAGLGGAVLRYLGAAVAITAAGIWLPVVGGEIAAMMGWQTTFVGTMLLAGVTSLPELVVSISAVRRGAADMAIAGLLGSNLFDMAIIAIDDIAYRPGPLLVAVSPIHAVTAFAAMIMSAIFIVALVYRPKTRLYGTISWASIGLVVIYVLSSYVNFINGH